MEAPVVIIGTGLAGYTVARELRRLDSTVEIQMFTGDNGGFYSKPMLSNGFSAKKTAANMLTQPAVKMAEQLQAEINTDQTVDAIDYAHQTILTRGVERSYSKLVLAVGAEPIRIPLQGNGVDAIVSVNNLSDYHVLLQRLEGKKSIAILGAGLIGCEFANDLCSAGYEVSLIDPGPLPLGRLLPAEIAEHMAQALLAAGINLHAGTVCSSVESASDGFLVSLQNGTKLHADVVISAVGLRPRAELATKAGIKVNKGIEVDRYLQTSEKNIYALGDCAEVSGLHLPYVMPIMQCARALAKTLAGQLTPVNYAAMPVVVKTPLFPLAISAPLSSNGQWQFDELGANGTKAIFYDDQNQPTGFVVSGDRVNEKRALEKVMPAWLALM
ncbi:FAD-dependent oxidoreductase [Pollutimonas harenae]|uniref:FAD-dependent oxidoreductase n=1 Tax=Pollutimonas harenae TaxID=657015 RepID=A0A853GSN1_9BURK|nr:FAD-dependent oxidoreductase [Pollutimonas harenae]NYT85167.1 FAD-dependent oxidoreductase [Pollutimonas harenae]TEA72454.1 FAD-dependent oxidoreductase [Pollutimonas harenae]